MDVSPETLKKHDVWVPSDSAFQRRCRLRQALWREAEGLPIGHTHRGEAIGSSLAMPDAETHLWNFLTPTIRDVVRAEVLDKKKATGKLFARPRIFNNLLSSQPLCFNLFGELSVDLALATRVFQGLCPGRAIASVTHIGFEHSPGRGDPRYTGDRSAFDVFVEYDGATGARGFLGIEVKLHEALSDQVAEHRPRYDDLADACGWWVKDRAALHQKPLQQMWRDHLLAASLIVAGDYDEGAFVFLAPAGNVACANAVAAFKRNVAVADVFAAWALEDVVDVVEAADASAAWVDTFRRRYSLSAPPSP